MPHTTYTDGQVLTASTLNTNVRDQVISTVTSGTRPTGTEGQVIYETDTQKLYCYNGSAWTELIDIDAWTSYTPTWTAASVNPAIGDGTITGAYIRIGRLVVVRVNITMGSTTTYGTGRWLISAPISRSASSAIATPLGWVTMQDAGSSTRYLGHAEMYTDAAKIDPYCFNTAGTYGVLADVDATTPFTWANTDSLALQVVYEADSA